MVRFQGSASPKRTRGSPTDTNPAAIQLRQVLQGQGLEPLPTATAGRGQGYWRVVQRQVLPAETRQCGCRRSWVKRDCLECSPLVYGISHLTTKNPAIADGTVCVRFCREMDSDNHNARCFYDLMYNKFKTYIDKALD